MLEINRKCGVCQACWEAADRHLQERDDLDGGEG